jgi:transcription elongation factor
MFHTQDTILEVPGRYVSFYEPEFVREKPPCISHNTILPEGRDPLLRREVMLIKGEKKGILGEIIGVTDDEVRVIVSQGKGYQVKVKNSDAYLM